MPRKVKGSYPKKVGKKKGRKSKRRKPY